MTGVAISGLVTTPPDAGLAFRPQIDALRAIAVIGVLYSHFLVNDSAAGSIGVRLFFVISGFLITRILLDMRERSVRGDMQITQAWKNFILRRALRILPIYYLTLAVAYLVDLDGFRDVAIWHAAFASNILFTLQDGWSPWPTAHLWSLSLEEQFYIFWPFLVLFLAFRSIIIVTIVVIMVGLLFRSQIFDFGLPPLSYRILPPAAFDTLGAGALLALLERRGWFPVFLKYIAPFAAVYLVLLCVRDLFPFLNDALESSLGYGQDPLTMISLVALVATAIIGVKGFAGRVLEWPPLLFVGRISYGIYLYHFFALALYYACLVPLNSDLFPHETGPAAVWATLMTLGAAMLSWYAIEEPLNRLKSRLA